MELPINEITIQFRLRMVKCAFLEPFWKEGNVIERCIVSMQYMYNMTVVLHCYDDYVFGCFSYN